MGTETAHNPRCAFDNTIVGRRECNTSVSRPQSVNRAQKYL